MKNLKQLTSAEIKILQKKEITARRRFEKKLKNFKNRLLTKHGHKLEKTLNFKQFQTKLENSKSQILTSNEKLILLDQDILFAASPIELESSKNLQLESLDLFELLQVTNDQLNQLTEKIVILETARECLKIELKGLKSILREWQEELELTKQLIVIEEDILYENEKKLRILDLTNQDHPNNQSTIFRIVNKFITNIFHEILPNFRISKHYLSRSERLQHLIRIDLAIADTIILILHDEDILFHLSKLVFEFRSIRLDLGYDYRTIRTLLKDNKPEQARAEILQNSSDNLIRINNAGLKFQTSILEIQSNVRSMFGDFDRYQKDILQSKSGTSLEKASIEFAEKIQKLKWK